FLVSTTSGGVARVAQTFEEWLQCEWVDLRVYVTNVTAAWANVTITGPRARDLLGRLEPGIDTGPDAFPHMSVREARIGGVPARILRVSFSGELGYEINVPAGYGEALWRQALAAGAELGAMPFGVEALMTLRTEKG